MSINWQTKPGKYTFGRKRVIDCASLVVAFSLAFVNNSWISAKSSVRAADLRTCDSRRGLRAEAKFIHLPVVCKREMMDSERVGAKSRPADKWGMRCASALSANRWARARRRWIIKRRKRPPPAPRDGLSPDGVSTLSGTRVLERRGTPHYAEIMTCVRASGAGALSDDALTSALTDHSKYLKKLSSSPPQRSDCKLTLAPDTARC